MTALLDPIRSRKNPRICVAAEISKVRTSRLVILPEESHPPYNMVIDSRRGPSQTLTL